MVDWGRLGGFVDNRSSRKLIIAYDHPSEDKTWAHSYVWAGQKTPKTVDVDGFRAADRDVEIVFKTGSSDYGWGWWAQETLPLPAS